MLAKTQVKSNILKERRCFVYFYFRPYYFKLMVWTDQAEDPWHFITHSKATQPGQVRLNSTQPGVKSFELEYRPVGTS